MKWYYWLILIVVIAFIANYFYKQKNGRNFVTFTVTDKQNNSAPQTSPNVVGCSDVQLAPPPPGKQYACVDGQWVLTDKF